MLAGLGAGLFKSGQDAAQMVKIETARSLASDERRRTRRGGCAAVAGCRPASARAPSDDSASRKAKGPPCLDADNGRRQRGSPPIRDVPVDWEALEDAFENNAPEVHSYLHLGTGEVLRVVDGIADPGDARAHRRRPELHARRPGELARAVPLDGALHPDGRRSAICASG